jgi:hypothetical protein
MGSTKTTHLDGDVSVGRHITLGGNADIAGSTHIGHDLVVDGWLEAPNIRGANKGFFLDEAKLQEAYPRPQKGWWAVVGDSIPGPIYVVEKGKWKNSGKTGGVGGSDFSQLREELKKKADATDITLLTNAINTKVDKEEGKGLSSNDYTDEAQAAVDGLSDSLNQKVDKEEGKVLSSNDFTDEEKAAVAKSYSSLEVNAEEADMNIVLYTNGRQGQRVEIPSATKSKAGVMSAADKKKLDAALSDISNLQDTTSVIESHTRAINELEKADKKHGTISFDGFTDVETFESVSANIQGKVLYDTTTRKFVLYSPHEDKYYSSFVGYEVYGGAVSAKGVTPYSGKIYICEDKAYMWANKQLQQISASGAAAIFNPTVEFPIQGYYALIDDLPEHSAVHVALSKKKAAIGLLMTFQATKQSWKTYQYIGNSLDESSWTNDDNWKDFGSLAAGSENYIVINNLCGAPTAGNYYTLESAVTRLIAFEQETGVKYIKTGLIIAYVNGENSMETKQFNGNVADKSQVALWKDFGGGSKVTVSEVPERGGKDAFSTGGAYTQMVSNLRVDTETHGTIKLAMVNRAGEEVGDEIQFNVGTGTGTGGTVVTIGFKDNPLYGKAGGKFVVKASIMSITTAGSIEQSNNIQDVSIIDRTTKQTVFTKTLNQGSSATSTDYSFNFDLSSLFLKAGNRSLQMQVTDDSGNTAMRNFSITAVDVTCVSVQTLNYTKDTTLEVGGKSKNIPMYAFPNNASDKGISVKVEINRGGAWETIQETTILDTYSHTVPISPKGLSHGAYALRIQGTDVASGVKGNMLHTGIMVLEPNEGSTNYDTPVIVARWSDNTGEGKQELFSSISFDAAAFQRSTQRLNVTLYSTKNGGKKEIVAKKVFSRSNSYTITKRLTDYQQGDSITFSGECEGHSFPENLNLTIQGTLIPISEVDGVYWEIDMAGRSNADSDLTIHTEDTDGGVINLTYTGANNTTNGFVNDSYGSSVYGTEKDNGRMSLRIAEDVRAELDRPLFNNRAIETLGMAFSMTLQTKNVAQRSAELLRCYTEGKFGFILTGDKLVVTSNGDFKTNNVCAIIPHVNDKVLRYDIVVEPAVISPLSGYGVVKIYRNGDEVGALQYTAGAFGMSDAHLQFDSTHGDIYLYQLKVWNHYYGFVQACDSYVVGLADTEMMIKEYERNHVLSSHSAEGGTKVRPSLQACKDAGLMVCVITKNSETADVESSYPDFLEAKDGDKKTKQIVDWYCYFPDRPWQDCKIIGVVQTNQGTTSSMRPIKNKKGKFKSGTIILLHSREQISAMYNSDKDILAKYDACAAMAAKRKIQIVDDGQFTNISTIKVDYSDSAGANNGAMMEMMNDVQIALGQDYMTPAQKANTGKYQYHTSIDSVPCALFRTDHLMTATEACDPANAYFHAKANFNADKGDAKFFGFEGVSGYNANCLNYGDFTLKVAARGQSLDTYKSEVLSKQSELFGSKYFVLAEFCGPRKIVLENDGTGKMTEVAKVEGAIEVGKTGAVVASDDVKLYKWTAVYHTTDDKYYAYKGGQWKDVTGSMSYDKNSQKWTITGKVVNPVDCYEYLKYDHLCWGQGVNSIDDMLAIDPATNKPIWMSYYESRYPDDDELTAYYKTGKMLPYNLYNWLKFCQDCNQNLTENTSYNSEKVVHQDGSTSYKYFGGKDAATTIALDGNMVPGTKENRLKKWQHELHKYANVKSTGCYIIAGDYKTAVDQWSKNMMICFYLDTDGMTRAYFNHWYDGDCVDGADNDCGLTIPWDLDSTKSTLYQGYDGVMFRQGFAAEAKGMGIWLDERGSDSITLHQIAASMRSVTNKTGMQIFSAAGSYHYWMEKRLNRWAQVISSFDGERKYIETAKAGSSYFYALHGLRLEDLPDFQQKRFAFRDGFYQVGDLYTNPFAARMMGTVSVKITAAQDGFFGLGEDRANEVVDSCYLKAGESYTLKTSPAGDAGKMIYIFGAKNLSKLDLSGCTPKQSAFNIQYCTLLEELIIGGEDYRPAYTTDLLSTLDLPQMPFLKKIDIRNSGVTKLDASLCPRLIEILAAGDRSKLETVTLAEASRIVTETLPSTITELKYVGLPKLAYVGLNQTEGVQVKKLSEVLVLNVERSPQINATKLLSDIVASQPLLKLSSVRFANQPLRGTGSELLAISGIGVKGIDASGAQTDKPVIMGEYELTKIHTTEDVEKISRSIEGIIIKIGIEAYIRLISEINAHSDFATEDEVSNSFGEVTLENIEALALKYFNGETIE